MSDTVAVVAPRLLGVIVVSQSFVLTQLDGSRVATVGSSIVQDQTTSRSRSPWAEMPLGWPAQRTARSGAKMRSGPPAPLPLAPAAQCQPALTIPNPGSERTVSPSSLTVPVPIETNAPRS